MLALALLAAACAISTPALAHNGMRDIGTTVRQLGRGGAFIATEPDAGSLSGNPGALGMLCGPDFSFDLRLQSTHVDYEGLLNAQSDDKQQWIPNAAYAAPLGNKLAWGIGVFSMSNQSFSIKNLDLSKIGAPTGTVDEAGSAVRYLAITPGIAVKLSDKTAVGASLSWSGGETDGQSYNMMGNTVGHSLSGLAGKGYSLRLGVYHEADPRTTLGAYWKSRSHLTVNNGTMYTGPMYTVPSAVIYDVEVEGGNFPEEYGVGIGHKLSQKWALYGEWRRLNWAKVRKTISVIPPQGAALQFPMNWSNQDVYVVGAEYRPGCDDAKVWRCGMNYGESPVPDNTLMPLFPATNELHLTAGYETKLNERWRLVTGLNYALMNKQTTTADNPNNLQFGGGQPFSTGASSWEFGVGLSWAVGKKPQPSTDEQPAPCDCPECSAGESGGQS
jgi:long-chain fatty acid transport protein